MPWRHSRLTTKGNALVTLAKAASSSNAIDDDSRQTYIIGSPRFAMLPESVLYSACSDKAIRLYAALTRHGDSEHACFPGRRRLSELLHCSLTSIDRALAELRDAGFIKCVARYRADGSQTSNELHLTAPLVVSGEPPLVVSGEGGLVVSGDPKKESHIERDVDTDVSTISRDLAERDDGAGLVSAGRAAERPQPFEQEFAVIWPHYPRKVNKPGALKAYRATRRRGVSATELMIATKHYIDHCRGKEIEYVMHASTFYGPNQRWRDYMRAVPATDSEAQWSTAARELSESGQRR